MRRVFVHGLLATAMAFSAASATFAAPPSTMPVNKASTRDDWWKHAVIYELYPRSFADSNNDGIGDLKGITNHLGYLSDLGVDAIWMTPMFPSPQADFGYDVADYDNVDPQFGTIADADALIARGKGQNVKIILDFVVNHTSDKHPWFIQSRSSKTNPYRAMARMAGHPITGPACSADRLGRRIPRRGNIIITSSTPSSQTSTGAIQRSRRRCSTPPNGG